MIKGTIKAATLQLFFPLFVFGQQYIAEGRSALALLPIHVAGVKNTAINLNGSWEFNQSPSPAFWNDRTSSKAWRRIEVPGEPSMQGFILKHDVPFVYRKKILIPIASFGKTILIRFNGVYSYARVWVNGNFIREHDGGFTAWDCDISKYVKPGKEVFIHVEVTDKIDDISYASGYAHHLIGGILRRVEMVILPSIHVQRLYADVSLDDLYKNGKVRLNIALNAADKGTFIEYNLIDPDGRKYGKCLRKFHLRRVRQ